MATEEDLIRTSGVQDMAKRLYDLMPGAERPPFEPGRGLLWGEVEGTPHYGFCERIALKIIRAAQAYSR